MEIEAKFYVMRLDRVAERLQTLGAELKHPRILEENWRYDTPDKSLEAGNRLLRLRQAHKVTLTYKSAAAEIGGVSHREEHETEVGDIEQIRLLLLALGYVVTAKYEKYRTEYTLGSLTIMLDELPFGDFVEIEGQQVSDIQGAAEDLGLDWGTNITANYLTLFSHLKLHIALVGNEITFAALDGAIVLPEMLGIRAGDGNADERR